MPYITLISGLLISAVSIYYSVAGLASIFSTAFIPVVIMGTALEVAKLVATVWLKQNWKTAPTFLRTYLLGSVIVLMVITSMGCFGYLSRAHSDQQLASGDVQSKLAVIDEKLAVERNNLDDAKRNLSQMNSIVATAVSSTDGYGANRANRIRNNQTNERATLEKQIQTAQANIIKLNDERSPIASQSRKVESEVGPIKYIAAFVYGDDPSANTLEKAVTWMILLIIIVFDPLAVMLLLASQYSFDQQRKRKTQEIIYEERETPPATVSTKKEEVKETPTVSDTIVQDVEPQQSTEIEFVHTPDATIVKYPDGHEEVIKAPEMEAGTYIQNEEQNQDTVWSRLKAKEISENTYQKKALSNKQNE